MGGANGLSRKVAGLALAVVGSGLAIAVAVAHPGGMQHGGPMGMGRAGQA